MRRHWLVFILSGAAFAGQSIQLSTATAGNSSIPAQPAGNPWRAEFSIHDWDPNPSTSHPVDGSAVGLNVTLYNLGGGVQYLFIVSNTAAGASAACLVNGLGPNGTGGGGTIYANKFVTVRFQEDPSSKTDYCQAWDIFGNLIINTSAPYVSNSGNNSNGAYVGGTGQNLSTAYFRIYSSIVPLNARPPVTADTTANCLVFWKFDMGNNTGSLNDSCGKGPYNAVMSSGSPVYVPTPGQNLVVPVLKTMNAPAWGNTASVRAGFPAQLDGTASYAQADASSNVNCFWQSLSGPTNLFWDNHASCTPTVQGLIFGDYQFQLTATSSSGTQAAATQHIGAVATDSNGVVVQVNPNTDLIYGPMIALGQNPWGLQDERALTGNSLQGPATGTATVINGSGAITATSGTFLTNASGGVTTSIVIGGQTYQFTWLSATTGSILPVWNGPSETVNWTQSYNFMEQALPTWATLGAGTVSYPMLGGGPGFGNPTPGTTLTASISATATSIPIADASKLPGLAALPDWILIGNALNGGQEVVRVVATTATSGAAMLTTAYDGRGVSAGLWSNINPPSPAWSGAVAHNSGDSVGEFRISGSGSKFSTDPNSALCPAGVPGPIGQRYYSAGTVTLTGGSATITGSGTNWTDSHGAAETGQIFLTDGSGNAQDYYVMFIQATHGGGMPFNWWAQLTNVGSTTSTTWSRPLPSDVDPGPFNYVILKQTAPALQFSDPNGTYNGIFESAGCESDTAAFAGAYYGFAGFDGTFSQTGQGWSYESDSAAERGISGAFGPNFYGTGLAQRALYYRSGLSAALNNANMIDEYWIKNPRNCGGWGCSGLELTEGGGMIGAIADLVLNSSTKLRWPDVRQWMAVGSIGGNSCDFDDTRDTGYQEYAPIAGALFDPDPTFRAKWNSAVTAINTRNNDCRSRGITSYPSEANSWANGFLWTNSSNQVTLTPGSTMGTATTPGQNIGANCDGVDTGTASVTAGSADVTAVNGSFTITPGTVTSIVIQGLYYSFTVTSSTTGTLSVLWPGSSGTYSFMTRSTNLANANTPGLLTFLSFTLPAGPSARITSNPTYACVYNAASNTIMLDRPWADAGASGPTSYYPYPSNLSGYGQQPYMLGIKSLNLTLGSQLDRALGTSFSANAQNAGSWVATYGFDYQGGNTAKGTQGMFYGRVYSFAEGATTQTGSNSYEIPGSAFGLQIGSVVAARELNQEAFNALIPWFTANPTPANKALADTAYGAIWCQTALTTSGAYCDANSIGNNLSQSNLTNAYLSIWKWYGYFFGVGMSHQWPAVRLGGVQPPRPRQVLISLNPGDVRGSATVKIVVTAPSGAQTTFTCSSQPCAVTVDDRQGTHLYQVQYFSAGGSLLSQSQPDLLAGPGGTP